MTNQSKNVVSLEAYRTAGLGLNAPDDATIRYGTADNPGLIEVEDMRFCHIGKWLVEQTRIRETMMVQARIRFSGNGTGRVGKICLATRPDPTLFEAMPFEVSLTHESASMLNAYDYMVGLNRYPADTIISAFPDGWLALESPEEYHGCLPSDAYKATAAWPV